MMIDGTSVDGFFVLFAALDTLVLGIANIALLKPPITVRVNRKACKRSTRIVTRRALWPR